MSKDISLEVFDGISKAGKPYKALRVVLKNVQIGVEVIERIELPVIFLDQLQLLAIQSKL